MSYVVTLPGKIGDILWAMPTVRLISEQTQAPVRLVIPEMWQPLGKLLSMQDYISKVCYLNQEEWPVRFDAPMQPWAVPDGVVELATHETLLNLGHSGWPSAPLYEQYYLNLLSRARGQWPRPSMRPWISVEATPLPLRDSYLKALSPTPIYYGMSEQWIELKAGILVALANHVSAVYHVDYVPGGRQREFVFQDGEAGEVFFWAADWVKSAITMERCALYVGCCSSQWVLACAMGVPVVLFDPDGGRHNPIFWWDGDTGEGPKNVKVLGADGQPTWDARAVCQTVSRRLEELNG